MLAADQTLPVFDYKPLEGIVKESEFAARKNTKQVAVKIPEDLAEVQRGRIGDSPAGACSSVLRVRAEAILSAPHPHRGRSRLRQQGRSRQKAVASGAACPFREWSR